MGEEAELRLALLDVEDVRVSVHRLCRGRGRRGRRGGEEKGGTRRRGEEERGRNGFTIWESNGIHREITRVSAEMKCSQPNET